MNREHSIILLHEKQMSGIENVFNHPLEIKQKQPVVLFWCILNIIAEETYYNGSRKVGWGIGAKSFFLMSYPFMYYCRSKNEVCEHSNMTNPNEI